jgi:protein-disulfide isomerase
MGGALLVAFFAVGTWAQESVPPTPISTNPADSPVRTVSGKVLASTDASVPPALGPDPARVLVVVFSDFQCPVCKRCADATEQIAEEFPGEVRAEFWQHALATHANAQTAAIASLAAQRQGKFWEYHDALFRNQNALDAASLERQAETIGLDVTQFKSDMDDPALRERVVAESALAEQFGATGTPALMINGKLHVGWGSWTSFRGDVERELVETRKLESAGTPFDQLAEARAKALITNPEQLQLYLDRVLAPKPEAAVSAAPVDPDPPVVAKKKDKKKKSRKSEAESATPGSAP